MTTATSHSNEKKLFNRDLSWLEFNARVFAEAKDETNPLLERLKFAGIVSSNFDEFFMVRMSSLEVFGEETGAVREKAYALIKEQDRYFDEILLPALEAKGISRIPPQGLSEKQADFAKAFFRKELFPVLTPIGLAADKQPPALINLSLYMVVCLVDSQEPSVKHYAVVELPKNFPRMISLPAEKGHSFLLLEDILGMFAKDLFKGYEIVGRGLMRLTRAAEVVIDEETDEDFAKVMTEALRKRRTSPVMRLEIAAGREIEEFLKAKLEIPEERICRIASWLDLKSISQLAFQPVLEELKRPAWVPRPVPEFEDAENIWDLLKAKDVWVHHPYDSFEAVNRFVREAAEDPDVLAIKQTLYRAGHDSSMITSLERAAENGKNVTVLVELKARFDEEKNISWARRLEVAGANVIYGVTGFKTHAKACLVVRREPEGIKRYLHLSTGNYNEKTAHIYSDIGFFSSRESLTSDAMVFFNMITGYSQPLPMFDIVVAPYGMRQKLKHLIQREVMRVKQGQPGLILAKMNSLVDPQIIQALYEASQAGVEIKLNVRGICCLRPGIKGLSDTIEVRSVVDMFLEHSRMFYFLNGGDGEFYLASADWMPRNFDRRIEIMFALENKEIKKDLTALLKLYFKDNLKSWRLLADGQYEKIEPQAGEKKFRVQEFLCKKNEEREELRSKAIPKELKPQKPRHD